MTGGATHPSADLNPLDVRAYAAQGFDLRRQGKLTEAVSLLQQGIARFPEDAALACEYAWTLSDMGDGAAAAGEWRVIRQRFPTPLDGYLGGGLQGRRAEAYDTADAIYRSGLARFPDEPALHVDYAWSAEERGDQAEAVRRWSAVRERFPDLAEGHLRLSVALLATQRIDEAEAALAGALERFPDHQEALIEYAWIAQIRGLWPEALTRWERVITRFPELSLPRRCGATVLLELGRYAEAASVLAPAARMLPDDPDVLAVSGWIATRSGDFKRAEAVWQTFRERHPERADGFRGGALTLRDQGRWDDAEAAMEEATRRFPDEPSVAMDWAELAERRQEWPLAVARWRDVLGRFPGLSGAHHGLGRALMGAQDFIAAEAVFTAGRQRFPDDEDMAAAEAEAAAKAHNWPRAIALWLMFRERFPGLARGAVALARTLRESGELEASVTQARAALQSFPDHLDLEVELAFTLSAMRDWPAALALWESLKAKHPHHDGLRSNITFILGQAMADQAIRGGAPFEIPRALLESANVDDVPAEDQVALLKRFESLGDSCEFGMVQRLYQVEQMTLLRWAFTTPENLIAALKTRFDGVGDPEYTEIDVIGDEYRTRDRRYFMQSHTFTSPTAEPLEFFAPEQCRRLQWLKRKLLDSLTTAARVFVYSGQGGLTEDQVTALHDAMLPYSPKAKLLCMRVKEPGHPPGTVERLRAGLWIGYLEKFSTVDIAVANWLTVCQTVTEQMES
jgi:tetratricopeptide (TPR) repeat protein